MTSNAGLKLIEDKAATAGFVKKRGRGDNPHAVYWRIQCCRCDTANENSWDVKTSPDRMVKNLCHKGWAVEFGKPPRCPAHAHHNPIPMGREAAEPSQTTTTTIKEKSPLASDIPKNPVLARKVFAALEEHFDTETCLYRNRMTDEKIAQDTGAALSLVVFTRDSAFGKLAENPEIGKIRDDLTLLKMEFDEAAEKFNRELQAIARRIEAIANGHKIAG